MVSAARKKCPVEKRKREGHLPHRSIYGATCFATYLREQLKNCSEKPSTCFLALDISDNWHICNCYLLIFNWLYRISDKNASIASLRSRRLEVAGERENGRAKGRHARVAPVFSCAHYFQAPATQAIPLQTRVCQHRVNRQPNQSKKPFQLRFDTRIAFFKAYISFNTTSL